MIFTLVFIFVFIAPSLWLKYTFKKNDKILRDMPFSPREFGNEILSELDITNVSLERTKTFDHYDPEKKSVRVLAERFDRKSLTALSIVCHEIRHAIQDYEGYKPLKQRTEIIKRPHGYLVFQIRLCYLRYRRS